MTVRLDNVHISHCGTGISAPKDADIVAQNLSITHTQHAIELRDTPGNNLVVRTGARLDCPPGRTDLGLMATRSHQKGTHA